MPRLDGAAVLSIWERGAAQALGERALTLLELTDIPPTDAPGMTAGARDAELLQLRRRLFGDRIEAVTECAACGEDLDLTLSVEELLGDRRVFVGNEVSCEVDGQLVSFRSPNAGDLAALQGIDDVEGGVALLIERCIGANSFKDSSGTLPAAVVSELDVVLAAADPGAEMRLISACPSCGARNEALFDIVSFLWNETQALASDVLWDVHTLASAYGWGEDAILALKPARRRFYLEALQR